MRHPLRRRLLSLAVTATAALVPLVVTASPAQAVPPTPVGLPAGIEGAAAYVGASSCDGVAKPGTVALGQMLTAAYPGTSFGTVRACGSDALSTTEHYDGRAVDWMGPNARIAASKKKGDDVVKWLLAADKAGHGAANAHRLGVMYFIWNNNTWSASRAQWSGTGWSAYSSCASHPEAAWDTTCHRNHVHISLSWEGAMKRTSWWTKAVAAPDYGPCRTPDLNWASPYRSAQPNQCMRYARVTAPAGASTLTKKLVDYSGMYVRSGSTGPVVSAVQQAIGVTADGGFGPATAAALRSWQSRNCLTATGVTDVATWRALIHAPRLSKPGPLVPGFDADGRPDLIARTATGQLRLYPGNGSGGFAAARVIGAGWGIYPDLLAPGDFTGDGKADIIGRTPAGSLCLHRGDGRGGWAPGGAQLIGQGWTFPRVLTPGDVTGDRKADLLAVTTDGRLLQYTGNGAGGFSGAGRSIGSGWGSFTAVVTPGDFDGDGRADIIARSSAGNLYLYAGSATGGFAPARLIGTGWNVLTQVLGAGDVDGDGHADLMGRTSAGEQRLYPGNGTGGFAASRSVGSGWTFPLVLAVR